jgi:hypothetical protein
VLLKSGDKDRKRKALRCSDMLEHESNLVNANSLSSKGMRQTVTRLLMNWPQTEVLFFKAKTEFSKKRLRMFLFRTPASLSTEKCGW